MVEIELIPASYTVCPNCDASDEINGNFEEGEELEITCPECGHKYKHNFFYDHDYEAETVY